MDSLHLDKCAFVRVCNPKLRWRLMSSYLLGKAAVRRGSYQSPLFYGCPPSAAIGYECRVGLCLQDGVGLATTVDFWMGSAVRPVQLNHHQPCLGFLCEVQHVTQNLCLVWYSGVHTFTDSPKCVSTLYCMCDLKPCALNIERRQCAGRERDGASSGWWMR